MSDDRVHRRTGGATVIIVTTEPRTLVQPDGEPSPEMQETLRRTVESLRYAAPEWAAGLLWEKLVKGLCRQVDTADASLIDRLHTAEAEVAILRSFRAGVPWESLYRVAQYEEGGQWSAHNECVQAWIAANRPQEATE